MQIFVEFLNKRTSLITTGTSRIDRIAEMTAAIINTILIEIEKVHKSLIANMAFEAVYMPHFLKNLIVCEPYKKYFKILTCRGLKKLTSANP